MSCFWFFNIVVSSIDQFYSFESPVSLACSKAVVLKVIKCCSFNTATMNKSLNWSIKNEIISTTNKI